MDKEKNTVQYGQLTPFTLWENASTAQMGFRDENGNERIPPIFYMRVTTSDGKIILNHDGFFKNGRAVVMNAEGKFGLIDENGSVLIPLVYDSLSNILLKDILFFRSGNTCGFMRMNQTILAEYPHCTSLRESGKHVYAIEYAGGAEKAVLDLTLLP